MSTKASVLADSLSPLGVRLTTLEVTMPRIILSEFNTHRMFSRNSASSRAIPVGRMIEKVMRDPFVPEEWGQNQKGMVAEYEVNRDVASEAEHQWLLARDRAVTQAQKLMAMGIHKQLANRLLEPFLWTTVIVTSTEWDNFFALRRHKDAQPEIRKVADAMWKSLASSTPRPAEVHLPLAHDGKVLVQEGFTQDQINLIAAARCARVSYLTHDGERNPSADIALAERLLASGHMSPFEHVAFAMTQMGWSGNFRGWTQFRKTLPNESVYQETK